MYRILNIFLFCIIYQCSGILQSVCQWLFSKNLLYSLIKELAMVVNMNRNLLYEIWGSHIGGYEDYALMEWVTMQFGGFLPPVREYCLHLTKYLLQRPHVPQKYVVCLSDCEPSDARRHWFSEVVITFMFNPFIYKFHSLYSQHAECV